MFEIRYKQDLGDEIFFGEIYYNYLKKVRFFAYNYLKNSEEAENVAQDVFMSVWENIQDVRTVTNMDSYLFVLTKYRCLNLFRRKKHYKKFESYVAMNNNISITALKDETSTNLYSKEVETLIVKALNEMSIKTKDTFIASKFKDKKNREIAEEFSITEKAVEYRISCAYKILRKNLKDYSFILSILISC